MTDEKNPARSVDEPEMSEEEEDEEEGIEALGEIELAVDQSVQETDEAAARTFEGRYIGPKGRYGESGERVGRYRITGLLGVGGMASVYKAEDLKAKDLKGNGRPVAIKMMHSRLMAEFDPNVKDSLIKRFKREARIMFNLQHPNIATILDVVKENPQTGCPYFIVMEYLEGQTLSERLEQGAIRDQSVVISHGIQLCCGLSKAHAEGIIHRDMKPENVFIMNDGSGRDLLKIMDFGIAQVPQVRMEGPSPKYTEKLTALGAVCGTPWYMAPEQATASQMDERVDVYAVGVILYVELSGRVPFGEDCDTQVEVMHAVLKGEFKSIREANPNAKVSAELEAIVIKAMSREREQRFQTIDEMKAALERVQQLHAAKGHATMASLPSVPPDAPSRKSTPGTPYRAHKADSMAETQAFASAPPVPPLPQARSRRPVLIAAAVSVAVAVIGLASWAFLGGPSSTSHPSAVTDSTPTVPVVPVVSPPPVRHTPVAPTVVRPAPVVRPPVQPIVQVAPPVAVAPSVADPPPVPSTDAAPSPVRIRNGRRECFDPRSGLWGRCR